MVKLGNMGDYLFLAGVIAVFGWLLLRAQYVLLDAEGNAVRQWNGYLNEARLTADLSAALADMALAPP